MATPVTLKFRPALLTDEPFASRAVASAARGKPGDLLVTVEVAVPQRVDGKAKDALEQYAEATAETTHAAT